MDSALVFFLAFFCNFPSSQLSPAPCKKQSSLTGADSVSNACWLPLAIYSATPSFVAYLWCKILFDGKLSLEKCKLFLPDGAKEEGIPQVIVPYTVS